MKDSDLTNNDDRQTVFVVGGSSGIGFEIAKKFLSLGATVAISGSNSDKLLAAKRELNNENVHTYQLDVTDRESISSAVSQLLADLHKIDVFVNSAGVSHQGTILDTSADAWNKVINTNLNGFFYTTQSVAQSMVKRKKGRIIFLASISGQQVWSGRAAYCSSKSGVIGLMKSCAIDLAPYGITVNSVSPGPVETPLTAAAHGEIIKDKIISNTPMARYARSEEISGAVAFLASDEASFITGHDLVIDGGLTSAAILYDLSKNTV
ncbi:SDR family oxidoreductase [Pantoea sp. Al-1710]|uniref:SDR family oxidoreductase n=1 Tax=Candidatus Pantoea communis TaxID=2608354 RepID=A0ABX0RQG7_9GAMM|nr:SDR family oxidoreductase [Pantoea communis]NIG19339.1 SDR family oxidoreductase [Pantoea communis]